MKTKAEFENRSWTQFKRFIAWQVGVLLAVTAIQTPAAPGDVDPSFGQGSLSMNAGVRAIALQSDGKVLIGGSFTTIQNAYRGRVARLNVDGSTDHSFLKGMAGANNDVLCLAVQPDGEVLIAGYFTAVNDVPRTEVARLNSDGSLDSSFVPNLAIDASTGLFVVNSLAFQSDGKVLVGGHFVTVGGVVRKNIARLNPDGSLDTSFVCTTGGEYPGYGSVDQIIVQGDGRILVGGWFTQVNGTSRSTLVRLNSDGSLDNSFLPVIVGANYPELDSLLLQPNGQIIVGGWFSTVNGIIRPNLVRLNANGSVDTSFLNGPTGPDNRVMQMTLQPDGKILIGGSFNYVNGVSRNDLARLNADGSLDASFSYTRPSSVLFGFALALQTDGHALVGFRSSSGPTAQTYIFRLNTDGTPDSTFTNFTNGSGGPNDWVLALGVQSDGKSIVGGQFKSISGVARNYLARLNLDGSLDNSFLNGLSGPNNYVDGLVIRSDDRMLITGTFNSVNGSARTGIALLNADGSLDNSFAPTLGGPYRPFINNICLQSDNKVVVGGSFTTVNGVTRPNLARLNTNGSLDNSFLNGLTGPSTYPYAISVQTDGKLVLGGEFTSVNGVARAELARLNADGSLDSSFLAGAAGPNNPVQLLAVQADGRILIGGQFTSVNGQVRTNFTRLNPDGSLDASFANYVAYNWDEYFRAMLVQPDGKILLASLSYGAYTAKLNRFNPDGSPDGSFAVEFWGGGGISAPLFAIALQTDGKILVGGTFTVANQTARAYVARLMGDYAPLAQFNYTTNNGTITITGYTGSGGVVTIPDTINGLPVTSIGDAAFYGSSNLVSVTIPDRVKSIGNDAFFFCTSLTNVTIGNGVTSIGVFAFGSCTKLTSVTIPESVTSIGSDAFDSCISLASVTLGNSVTTIGDWTFYWCISLTSVTIPNSVTSIGDYAFEYCANLNGVYFKGNAPRLAGSSVFYGDNNATVYYLTGTTGWGSTFGGLPTVLWSAVPVMQTSPQTQTAEKGSIVHFTAHCTGSPTLTYQWFFNSTNAVSEATTNSDLKLTSAQFSQSGAYAVVVTNLFGAVTSAPAMLNVIAPVERKPIPGVAVTGEVGSKLNVDYANSLTPAPDWTTLGSVSLTSTSQLYFDLTAPLPPQRFYRAWQMGTPGVVPSLNLTFVPAITLTGNVGDTLRLDYINAIGSTDAWVTLDTVTLTNTSQLYFDVSVPGQPTRLYRIVLMP